MREANKRIARNASSLPGMTAVDPVGRAIGIDHRHDRDIQTVRFGDRDLFLAHVDDKKHVRQAVHIPDTGQVFHQAFVLAVQSAGALS